MYINESSISWNSDIFNFINHNLQNPILDQSMPIITNFGTEEWLMIIVFILLITSLIAKKDKLKKIIIIFLISIIVSIFITELLKGIFSESRPFIAFSNVHLLADGSPFRSFPSGHSSNIFTLITVFGLNYSLKIRGKSFKLLWVLLPLGILVALSRVYVGVHFPLDLIAGTMIGIVSGGIVSILINKYIKLNKYLSIITFILFVLVSVYIKYCVI
ncbi:MAG: phosphatase PAP2 family protein [Methanobrevibacter sp.]|jgi:undecaprenyl-diphosphatase|nr:phosphatase PAP2 family protein [Methanobrevibacter sp.]